MHFNNLLSKKKKKEVNKNENQKCTMSTVVFDCNEWINYYSEKDSSCPSKNFDDFNGKAANQAYNIEMALTILDQLPEFRTHALL